MSNEGRVSAVLSAETVSQIRGTIEGLRGQLPFLVALSTAERQRLVKAGPRRARFVQSVVEFAEAHPELVPAQTSLEELRKDWELYNALTQFETELAWLAKAVEDTRTVVGSEAMNAALMVWGWFRAAKRMVPGLAAIAAELTVLFKRRGRSPSVPPPPAGA